MDLIVMAVGCSLFMSFSVGFWFGATCDTFNRIDEE
jgi:hypothetical protein